MEPQLDWTCDECAGSSQATWVILSDVQMERAMGLESKVLSRDQSQPISLADLMKLDLDPGMWSAMCPKHTEVFPESGYFFETSRIDTIPKALDWTLHLLEKGWLQHTNWDEFLRSKLTADLDA